MPKSGTRMKTAGKLHFSESVSSNSLKLAAREVNKWEGERKELGTMALYDLQIGGPFKGLLLKDGSGKLQGIVSYTRDANTLLVERIATSGKMQGLGTAMMKHLADMAARNNSSLTLRPTETSASFYEKLGMRKNQENLYEFTAQQAKAFARS